MSHGSKNHREPGSTGAGTTPGGSNTQVQYNNSGSFGGDADLIWTAGTGLIINSQKELRLADSDDSA